MTRIVANSNRSRTDMYASGSTFIPTIARDSEVKDSIFLDAAYATIKVS